jgi:CBS domain-containing protein
MEYLLQETARENMTRPARTVAPELTVGDLLRLFASGDSDAYPVVRGEKLVGVVSRADAIEPFCTKPGGNDLNFDAIMGTTVQEIMSSRAVAVTLDAPLEQVVQLMKVHDFESFPVVDHENRVKGVIALEDVVRALARCTWSSSLPLPLSPMGYAIA